MVSCNDRLAWRLAAAYRMVLAHIKLACKQALAYMQALACTQNLVYKQVLVHRVYNLEQSQIDAASQYFVLAEECRVEMHL